MRSIHDFPPLRSSRSRARCPASPLIGAQLVVSSDRQCCQRSLSVSDGRTRATVGPMALHDSLFFASPSNRPLTPLSRTLRRNARRLCTMRTRPMWARHTPRDLWIARAQCAQPHARIGVRRLGTQEHLLGTRMPTRLRSLLHGVSTDRALTRLLRKITEAGGLEQPAARPHDWISGSLRASVRRAASCCTACVD